MRHNLKEVELMGEFKPAPEGFYNLRVVECENKPTKAGDGTGLNFKFQIEDGDHAGKNVFDWINIKNNSSTAVKIGMSAIKTIRTHVELNPDDFDDKNTQEYVGKVVGAKLVIEKYNGKEKNKVLIYAKAIPVNSPTAPQPRVSDKVPF